jgi:hypothetical protein
MIGANILMPNITPGWYRDSYKLYDNKPCTDDSAEDCQSCLEARISLADAEVVYGEWGDSKHFDRRQKTKDKRKLLDARCSAVFINPTEDPLPRTEDLIKKSSSPHEPA